jgi:hypothetical protein
VVISEVMKELLCAIINTPLCLYIYSAENHGKILNMKLNKSLYSGVKKPVFGTKYCKALYSAMVLT